MVVFTTEELLELTQAAHTKTALLDLAHSKYKLWKAIEMKLESLCMEQANNFINQKQQNHENTSNT